MYISKETIQTLKSLGINVRWYPEKTYEAFKQRVWREMYDFSYNYSKDHVRGSKATEEGRANVLYESMEEFEEKCRKFADQTWERHASPYEYTTLYIEHDGGRIYVKKENVKSKKITVDYVMKYVDKSRKLYAGYYGVFTLKMQQICEKLGYSNFCVYPTTYGIGVWVFYNHKCNEQADKVESILKRAGIEYYNEFSDARWVFRFKISKKKNNLEKIFKVA